MDMAPTFKLLVTIVNPMGELVADSVTVPVRSINRYQVVYLIMSSIFLDVLVVFELLLIFNSFWYRSLMYHLIKTETIVKKRFC